MEGKVQTKDHLVLHRLDIQVGEGVGAVSTATLHSLQLLQLLPQLRQTLPVLLQLLRLLRHFLLELHAGPPVLFQLIVLLRQLRLQRLQLCFDGFLDSQRGMGEGQ